MQRMQYIRTLKHEVKDKNKNALNTLKCNYLTPVHFKGLKSFEIIVFAQLCYCCSIFAKQNRYYDRKVELTNALSALEVSAYTCSF